MAWATAALIGSAWDTAHHDAAGVALATQPVDGADDAGLHLEEALAAGEAEAARVALHGLPLGQLHERLQLAAGPLAEVALEQALVDDDLQAAGLGDRRGRLPGPLERRGVDGVDLRQLGDALRRPPRPGSTPASARCRPGARPGAPVPVVGVWPWRTKSTSVAWESAGVSCRGVPVVGMAVATYRRGRGFARIASPPRSSACRACPRLVAWREQVAVEKRAAFADEDVLGSPGARASAIPTARILVVGLAPAAHGGNRTGRVFTGDRSGDWLFRAMYRAGLANQPTSTRRRRRAACSTAPTSPPPCAARRRPTSRRPTSATAAGRTSQRELALLADVRVVVCLGAFAYEAWPACSACGPGRGSATASRSPSPSGRTLLCSFHPSQQNTFTGRLTEPMLDAVFARAAALAGRQPSACLSAPAASATADLAVRDQRAEREEHVHLPVVAVERGRHAGGLELGGVGLALVAERIELGRDHQRRRQPGPVGVVQRRQAKLAAVGAGAVEVVPGEPRPSTLGQEVALAVLLDRREAQRHVGRRVDEELEGEPASQRMGQDRRQVAAGRVAADGDAGRVAADVGGMVEHPRGDGQGVVDRRRELVLGARR